MTKYKAHHYITGRRVIREYEEQFLKNCLDKLKPNVMNIAVWNKSFENETDDVFQTEKWYQTSYVVRDIQPEWIQTWSN